MPVATHGGLLVTVPGIFVDHRAGGRLAARHLTSLGRTSLAVIGGRPDGKVNVAIWELRAAGFLAEQSPVDVHVFRIHQ